MRKILSIMMLVLLIGVAQAQDDFPVLVGVVTDLSGQDANAGESHLNGLALGLLYAADIDPIQAGSVDSALASLNVAGRGIELMIRDYGANDPDIALEQASEVARDLIEFEFVDVLVGAPDAAVTAQLQQFAAPENFDFILFAGPTGAATVTEDDFHVNTFRLCPHIAQYGRGIASDATGYGLITGNSIGQTVDDLNSVADGAQVLTPYAAVDTEANRWLTERYAALFNAQPELYAGCGFATGQALYAALEATGGDPFPDVMMPALEGMSIDAPEGTYTIRESDHQALRPVFVMTYAGQGQLDIVEAISSADSAIDCNLSGDLASRC